MTTTVTTPVTSGFNLTAAVNFVKFLVTQDQNAIAVIETLASEGMLTTMFPSLAGVETEAQAGLKVFLGMLTVIESLFPGTPITPVPAVLPAPTISKT